jgi:hypothetical protein
LQIVLSALLCSCWHEAAAFYTAALAVVIPAGSPGYDPSILFISLAAVAIYAAAVALVSCI